VKFTPKPLREEVNISPENPLREFFLLAGGILGVFLLVYVVLGFSLDFAIARIGPDLENRLGAIFLPALVEEESDTPAGRRLQMLLDTLVAEMEVVDRNYRVHLVASKEANALALPGGHIVVLSGLVKEAASENELAMILGHELGHFQNRDHLRGLGRGLVLVFLSSLLFGADSSLANVATSLLGGAEMQFSQRQELQADAWGLALLVRKYGHAGGATSFFGRLAKKEEGKELAYLFASHPYPQERVEALEEAIAIKEMPRGDTLPLDAGFLLPEVP
jgi:predicted Zn-dependent protease